MLHTQTRVCHSTFIQSAAYTDTCMTHTQTTCMPQYFYTERRIHRHVYDTYTDHVYATVLYTERRIHRHVYDTYTDHVYATVLLYRAPHTQTRV